MDKAPTKRTGQLKLVKEETKKKDYVQYCIDAYLLNDVFKEVPSTLRIYGACVVVGKAFNKHKMVVPNRLRKLGVTTMREHLPAQEAYVVFDEVSRKTILEKVTEVAKCIGADVNNAYFKYIVLSNGKGNGKFVRTCKDIRPDETDLRRKLTVLGLEEASGDIASLISDLSVNAYACDIQSVQVQTRICRKV